MRILFLSHYFPPEINVPAVRTYEHCRTWARHGHEVHVVTCLPNHPQGKVYQGYKSRLCVQHEEKDGVHVHRVWTYVAANRGVVRRTLGYLSYMASAFAACLRLPRPDVVIATSPQFFCACAGLLVARARRCPWVFELRDLWPASIAAVGALRNGAAIRLLERVEMGLYRDARAIIVVTHSLKEDLAARGVPDGKIHVVTNGTSPAFRRNVGRADARMQLGLDSKFIVSYVGTHGMAHGLEVILGAAALLRHEPGIQFILVGDGAEREKLLRLKEEQRLRNVVLAGQVSRPRARLYLEASDVSVVHLRRAALFRTALPSKMFEAMAVENPIILGVDGEARRVLEEAEAGICIEPENARQLADAVLRLRSDGELRNRLGRNGRAAVAERFDREVLAERMLGIVERVGMGSGAGAGARGAPARAVSVVEQRKPLGESRPV